MSLNRAVKDTRRPPPSKIPVPTRKLAPATEAASSQADKIYARLCHERMGLFTAKNKAIARSQEPEATSTELDKLESLRAKLERSADEFIKARKELEEILPADGSSEQRLATHTGSAAGLKEELRRFKELTSKVESSLEECGDARLCSQEPAEQRSSYDFLRSIIG